LSIFGNNDDCACIITAISPGAWQATTSLIFPRHGAATVVVGNYVYVLGGYINNEDGSLGTWQTMNAMNLGREGHAAVAVGNYL
jgi:hypothetical protein